MACQSDPHPGYWPHDVSLEGTSRVSAPPGIDVHPCSLTCHPPLAPRSQKKKKPAENIFCTRGEDKLLGSGSSLHGMWLKGKLDAGSSWMDRTTNDPEPETRSSVAENVSSVRGDMCSLLTHDNHVFAERSAHFFRTVKGENQSRSKSRSLKKFGNDDY